MKRINVFLSDGSMITCDGEVMLDPREGSLTLMTEQGGYSRFNWAHVLFYVEAEPGEDDDDE